MSEKNIILVGNSPTLLNSNLGREIDLYTNVLRFNNYKMKSYENDCGSKTTMICINKGIYKKYVRKEININKHQLNNIFVIYQENTIKKTRKHCKKFILFLNKKIEQLKNKFNIPSDINLSSGLILILYFIDKYNHIHITGFDHSIAHYFKDAKSEKIFDRIHNWNFERQFVEDYINRGIIIKL